MINHPVWHVEDGVLLRELRQTANIDDFVFARMNAISLAQLRELEGRGEGSFYNPQIKTNTGNKLLLKLGHQRAMPAPAPALPAETASQALSLTPARSASVGTGQSVLPDSMPFHLTGPMGVHPKWAAAVLFMGGLVWALSHMPWPEWIQHFSAHALNATRRLQSQHAAPAPEAFPLQDTFVAAPPEPTAKAAEARALLNASTALSEGRTGANCDWRQLTDNATYEPLDPIKAGNYIHFVATQDVKLCVRDQKNQLADLQLKAGSAQSVYGEPPFLVHSPSWQNLQVFFQGRRVTGTPDGAAYWVFKSKDL